MKNRRKSAVFLLERAPVPVQALDAQMHPRCTVKRPPPGVLAAVTTS
jgi:hypothetical protein